MQFTLNYLLSCDLESCGHCRFISKTLERRHCESYWSLLRVMLLTEWHIKLEVRWNYLVDIIVVKDRVQNVSVPTWPERKRKPERDFVFFCQSRPVCVSLSWLDFQTGNLIRVFSQSVQELLDFLVFWEPLSSRSQAAFGLFSASWEIMLKSSSVNREFFFFCLISVSDKYKTTHLHWLTCLSRVFQITQHIDLCILQFV